MKRLFSFNWMLVLQSLLLSQALPQSQTWKQIDGLYGGDVGCFAIDRNGYVFAGTDGGVYRSTDRGSKWQRLNLGTTLYNWFSALLIHPSGVIIAASDDGPFRSIDNGATWEMPGWPNQQYDIRSFIVDSTGRIYAGCYREGIITSSDSGRTWTSFALSTISILDMHLSRAGRWFVAAEGGLYKSADTGKTWQFFSIPNETMRSLQETKDGSLFVCATHFVLRSVDSGESWVSLTLPPDYKGALFVDNNDRVFLGSSLGIFSSTDHGSTWQESSADARWVISFAQDSAGSRYAGTVSAGIYRSTDGKIWNRCNQGLVASRPRVVCESPSGALFASSIDGIQISRDDGETWATLDSIARGGSAPAIVNSRGHIFAAGVSGMIRSTNDGTSWTTLSPDVSSFFVSALAVSSSDAIFAGTSNGEVFRSTDEGLRWTRVLSASGFSSVDAMLMHPNGTLYVNRNNTVLRSRDNGNTWQEGNSSPSQSITSFGFSQNGAILAATYAGIYVSRDGGETWMESNSGLFETFVSSLCLDAGGSIYAAAGQYVFQSVDDGKTWNTFGDGITALFVGSVRASSKGYIFAGTQSYGLYRTVNAVKARNQVYEFALRQNYPNPFNSQTNIEFSLSQPGNAELVIYDCLGKEIKRLAVGDLNAGYHVITWNAKSYASGVYFYQLRTGSNLETKKLVLLK